MENKHPLILFTGGMDSSLLLKQKLKESHCDVFYLIDTTNPAKVAKEQAAQAAIIAEYSLGRFHVAKRFVAEAPIISSAHDEDRNLFGRLMVAVNQVVDPNRHSAVYCGGVRQDSFYHFRQTTANLWSELNRLTHWRNVHIEFPYIYKDKEFVLTSLDEFTVKKVWVCDHPFTNGGQIKRCGYCSACKLLKETLTDYKRKNGIAFSKQLLLKQNSKIGV
jgi:7-cyano-7-deazaguanine synthase in queuosine biosynthesis